jgi:hypothetical protein
MQINRQMLYNALVKILPKKEIPISRCIISISRKNVQVLSHLFHRPM